MKFGGFGGRDQGTDEEAEEQAVPVLVGAVRRGPITASISAASTIEAERHVTVHAESTGRIIKLAIEEGDKVKKGQLLARIKYEAQSSGLDRAETSFERVRADYENVKALYQRNVASKDELNAARVAYENARIDVRDRERDVRNTRVLAPFAGTVTERFVSEGSFIASGQQLLSVTDFDTLVARVYVPEKELDRIKVGQPASVVGKAAKGRLGTGTVRRVAPIVDPTTGTVKLTVGLPPELAGGEAGFLPGMYAEVTLTTERREDALLVPKQAVVHDEEDTFVFVVEGDRARRTRVKPGFSDAEKVEILEGLDVGMEIVVAGQSGLKEGALIGRVDEDGNPVDQTSVPDKGTGSEIANGRMGKTEGQPSGGA
jgi:membrane fusion protein (multidrug efflux system)